MAPAGLEPLKAIKRGALSTPGSTRPRSLPPSVHVEGEHPQEETSQGARVEPEPQVAMDEVLKTWDSRAYSVEGTILALGAINPTVDIDLGSAQKPAPIMVDLFDESPERVFS